MRHVDHIGFYSPWLDYHLDCCLLVEVCGQGKCTCLVDFSKRECILYFKLVYIMFVELKWTKMAFSTDWNQGLKML